MTLFDLSQGRADCFEYEHASIPDVDGVSSHASKHVKVSRVLKRVPAHPAFFFFSLSLSLLLWITDRTAVISFPTLSDRSRVTLVLCVRCDL